MRILLWGTGSSVRKYMRCMNQDWVVGFIETTPKSDSFMGKPNYPPNALPEEFDLIFVASVYCNEIYQEICRNHIPIAQVCFMHVPYEYNINLNDNLDKASRIFGENKLVFIDGYDKSKKYNYVYKDLEEYNRLNTRSTFTYRPEYKHFIEKDKYNEAGSIGVYFWQDLWGAQLVREHDPEYHYDIGSRVDGFIAHLLAFRKKIRLIDIRPLDGEVEGLEFVQGDATNLDGIEDNSIESISALCSLEHFGLGRYGDSIDPDACFKAFDAIQRKVKQGGCAYISVPIGSEHIEFNAHRIFYAQTIVNAFNQMELVQLDATSGNKIEYDIDIHKYDDVSQKGAGRFGLFCFKKI